MFIKLQHKIEKLLKIKRCYLCNKCIWWSKGTARTKESPKDEYGFKIPICQRCLANIKEA